MNKCILMGRLTRDPEIRYSQGANATSVARFSIAVDRRFKRDGEPEADFFNCTAFGKQAEFCEKYLKQGTKMVVVGRIQNDNYTDKEGQKRYSVQIMVDELEFAESKGSQAGAGAGTYENKSQGSVPKAGNENVKPAEEDFMNAAAGLTDELPFS